MEGKEARRRSFSSVTPPPCMCMCLCLCPRQGVRVTLSGGMRIPAGPNLRQSHVDGGREAEVEAEKLPVVPTPKQSGDGGEKEGREVGRPCSTQCSAARVRADCRIIVNGPGGQGIAYCSSGWKAWGVRSRRSAGVAQ